MKRNALSVALGFALITLAAGCTSQQAQDALGGDQPRKVKEERQLALQDDADLESGNERDGTEQDEGRTAASGEAKSRSESEPRDMRRQRADLAGNAGPRSAPAATTSADASTVVGLVAKPEAEEAVAMSPSIAPTPTTQAVAGQVAPGYYSEPANRERYQDLVENPLQLVREQPVSTFSVDVDSGSYSNVRRMLNQGQLPPADAVRAEEFINYFDYAYTPPASRQQPFSVTTELAPAPWNPERELLLIGLEGYSVPVSEIPASNLVFLIDTSGSMYSPDKLPLLQQAFSTLVESLREQDRVSIVVYAGSAGLILPPTSGADKERILSALNQLQAGGSTNGGAGIELAYAQAKAGFIDGGVNRVILATDGDFNVGTVDTEALKTLVTHQRESGVALTTLGFGQGNYNEELSEQLADLGNGNHYYIDTLNEAQKVLSTELSSTMLTIAKDVKIQIEFNPDVVAEYRLIGYENRMLRREDFNNDRIDAGEIGAGHDVTALYELTLTGKGKPAVDPLRYGSEAAPAPRATSGELAWVKLRYKQPEASESQLIEQPVHLGERHEQASERLAFAAAVAAFADSLRGSRNLADFELPRIADLARRNVGNDPHGYRQELVGLIERAAQLKGQSGEASIAIAH